MRRGEHGNARGPGGQRDDNGAGSGGQRDNGTGVRRGHAGASLGGRRGPSHGQPEIPADVEEADPGLARERTQMAWTRTAIAFAAIGAVIFKTRPVPGVIVLALGAATWAVTRFFPGPATDDGSRPRQLLLVTVSVTAVALVSLVIAMTARVS